MANLGLKKTILEVEDDHHIKTEWDAWDDLVQKRYDFFDNHKEEEGLRFWQEAWVIFESAMKQISGTETLYGLME